MEVGDEEESMVADCDGVFLRGCISEADCESEVRQGGEVWLAIR